MQVLLPLALRILPEIASPHSTLDVSGAVVLHSGCVTSQTKCALQSGQLVHCGDHHLENGMKHITMCSSIEPCSNRQFNVHDNVCDALRQS